MINITHEIALNVKRYDKIVLREKPVIVEGKQGDVNVRTLIVQIKDGNAVIMLDGSETVFLNAARTLPDTKACEKETFVAEVEGGKIKINLPPWVFNFGGRTSAEFLIEGGGSSIRTETFEIRAFDAVRDTRDVGDDENVRTLTQMIEEMRQVIDEMAGLPTIAAEHEGKYLRIKDGVPVWDDVEIPSNYGMITYDGGVLTVS